MKFLALLRSCPVLLVMGCAASIVAPPASLSPVWNSGLAPSTCVSTGPERCFDAVDDNCNGLIDEGCGLQTGTLQFVIAWDDPDADVDLVVTDPLGDEAGLGKVTKAGLIKDRDCPLGAGRGEESVGCNGQNVENVFLGRMTPQRGRYGVRVRLERVGRTMPPLAVRLGVRVGQRTYHSTLQLSQQGEQAFLSFDL